MTTNETYFYRTPRIWEYLNQSFIPEWHRTNSGRLLNIWSAASSSGEEAYTTAIFCQEFQRKNPSFQFRIHATDISPEILDAAQSGIYAEKSIDAFRNAFPILFQKYLKSQDGKFQICPEIQAKVRFQGHNLFSSLNLKIRFDLVFLRNVLIYFAEEDQKKVLNQVHRLMNKNSILIIGESESLSRLEVPFSYRLPLVYEATNQDHSSTSEENPLGESK